MKRCDARHRYSTINDDGVTLLPGDLVTVSVGWQVRLPPNEFGVGMIIAIRHPTGSHTDMRFMGLYDQMVLVLFSNCLARWSPIDWWTSGQLKRHNRGSGGDR